MLDVVEFGNVEVLMYSKLNEHSFVHVKGFEASLKAGQGFGGMGMELWEIHKIDNSMYDCENIVAHCTCQHTNKNLLHL